jgi:uncharacterized protein YwqG
MVNPWFQHLKTYALKNNMSYACASTDHNCKNEYKKITPIKRKKEEEDRIETEKLFKASAKNFVKRIKEANESELHLLKTQFRRRVIEFQNYFKDNYNEYCKKYYTQKMDKLSF